MAWTNKQRIWPFVIVAIGLMEYLGYFEQAEVYTALLVIIVLVLLDISADIGDIYDRP